MSTPADLERWCQFVRETIAPIEDDDIAIVAIQDQVAASISEEFGGAGIDMRNQEQRRAVLGMLSALCVGFSQRDWDEAMVFVMGLAYNILKVFGGPYEDVAAETRGINDG